MTAIIISRWQRVRHRVRTVALMLALSLTGLLPSGAGDIRYVYDQLGRLMAVIDPATDTAIYSYDAVGNLLGITRQNSSTLALFQFTPDKGPVGTTVTIYGTGFSATPASNTVKFNGRTATVATASITVLTTIVPVGATTGTISVTVAGTTATSTGVFTVGAGQSPTISGLSPATVAWGNTLTINGTSFNTIPANNRVGFSGALAPAATATATVLTVAVPSGSQTGPVSVSTALGSATSTQELFIVPPGVNPVDVSFTGRMTVGGANLVASVAVADKLALVVFNGTAGQRVNLGIGASTIAQAAVSLYAPNGTQLAAQTVTGANGSLDSPVLPLTGTYAVLIDPWSTYTGNMTLTLSAELTGTIVVNGAAVPVAISRVGQNARYTFSGTANQQVSLNLTASSIAQGTVTIVKPDGTNLAAATSFSTAGGFIDAQTLPVTGTYEILVDPTPPYTGSVTLTLGGFNEITGTIIVDGPAVTSTITAAGQNARYTFSGTAGQWINIGFTSVTINSLSVSLLKPDGTTLVSTTVGTAGGSLDPTTALPATGTYTILLNPSQAQTGNATITLSQELAGVLTVNDPAVPITISRPGQNARYIFSGTATQQVTVSVTGNTMGLISVSLYDPNGTFMAGVGSAVTSFNLATTTLPTTATYIVTINPNGIVTGALNLQVTSP